MWKQIIIIIFCYYVVIYVKGCKTIIHNYAYMHPSVSWFTLKSPQNYNILKLFILTGNFTYEYRLVNGQSEYEGRFEIRRNGGPWGTVCGNNWNTRYASVACRSLGFSSSALSPDRTTKAFGDGTGPVHLLLVFCRGNESSIIDCEHDGWDPDSEFVSTHCRDAGLYCLPGKFFVCSCEVIALACVRVRCECWGVWKYV